eukprot:1146166-Amorphochlora_amoeboformis.AAC.1
MPIAFLTPKQEDGKRGKVRREKNREIEDVDWMNPVVLQALHSLPPCRFQRFKYSLMDEGMTKTNSLEDQRESKNCQ